MIYSTPGMLPGSTESAMKRPTFQPHNQTRSAPSGCLTTLTAVAAVLAALGLTAAESAFGAADAAANAAILMASDTPCIR